MLLHAAHQRAHQEQLPKRQYAIWYPDGDSSPAGRRNRCNPAGDTCDKYDPHAAKELELVLQTVLVPRKMRRLRPSRLSSCGLTVGLVN